MSGVQFPSSPPIIFKDIGLKSSMSFSFPKRCRNEKLLAACRELLIASGGLHVASCENFVANLVAIFVENANGE